MQIQTKVKNYLTRFSPHVNLLIVADEIDDFAFSDTRKSKLWSSAKIPFVLRSPVNS